MIQHFCFTVLSAAGCLRLGHIVPLQYCPCPSIVRVLWFLLRPPLLQRRTGNGSGYLRVDRLNLLVPRVAGRPGRSCARVQWYTWKGAKPYIESVKKGIITYNAAHHRYTVGEEQGTNTTSADFETWHGITNVPNVPKSAGL